MLSLHGHYVPTMHLLRPVGHPRDMLLLVMFHAKTPNLISSRIVAPYWTHYSGKIVLSPSDFIRVPIDGLPARCGTLLSTVTSRLDVSTSA
jgi:hypothetical protein